ncbi:hypothetical protein GCM10010298_41120 [Streptomyces microflavus]|uniref:Short-chain fatty acyl coenzyme A regulators C-terminal domain-containing protein n=1 Tax=Streptomyces microflavus TaxID=1919 RepID=A0A7J0D0S4_STRMI|nr:hypothetical protein Smic_69070 [Streptomyces microflavus]GGX72014.1 hypothetical protein GCM10010298_41120 [Streptomyces microflavus]
MSRTQPDVTRIGVRIIPGPGASLAHAEGMALDDPRSATPIGLGCRICERQDCAQRARPPAGGRPAVDPDRRTHVLYPVVADGLSAPPSGISGE